MQLIIKIIIFWQCYFDHWHASVHAWIITALDSFTDMHLISALIVEIIVFLSFSKSSATIPALSQRWMHQFHVIWCWRGWTAIVTSLPISVVYLDYIGQWPSRSSFGVPSLVGSVKFGDGFFRRTSSGSCRLISPRVEFLSTPTQSFSILCVLLTHQSGESFLVEDRLPEGSLSDFATAVKPSYHLSGFFHLKPASSIPHWHAGIENSILDFVLCYAVAL